MSLRVRSEPNERFVRRLAELLTRFARVYHRFEVYGAENIPAEGPALIVAYHGLIPLDGFYFVMDHYLRTGRLIRGLTDRTLFRLPGANWLFRAIGTIPGQHENAVSLLEEGHLVGVFPGGVREAMAGEARKYELIWNRRQGFARVALAANAPIIPAFSENADELYKAPMAGSAIIQRFYEQTHLPVMPIVGLGVLPFPVKVRAWIGAPIHPAKDDTPEALAARTKAALEGLIATHQTPGQTLLGAIQQRLREGGGGRA